MALDPYTILGVPRSATEAEIKKAFRAKAKTLHPDQHPGDKAKEEEFKRLSGAFEILGDTEKRAKFDRGEIDGDGNPKGFAGGHPGGGTRWESGASPFGAQGDPFEDILSGMFGSSARRRNPGPQKGRDVRYRVEISFEDAVTGARRRMAMACARFWTSRSHPSLGQQWKKWRHFQALHHQHLRLPRLKPPSVPASPSQAALTLANRPWSMRCWAKSA